MRRSSFVGFVLLATLAACGPSGPNNYFSDPSQTEGASGSVTTGGGSLFGDDTGGPLDARTQCGVIRSTAFRTHVNMVVVYDRSGSMGDAAESASYDPKKRWIPVGDAMKSFFADAGSRGMRASLTYFPNAGNACASSAYQNPDVPLTELPSPDLGASIDATAPRGDTPTRAALAGAITQAERIAQGHPADRTVIVLATDGEPWSCGVTSWDTRVAEVNAIALDVGRVHDRIPTYVIGVGPSVDLLHQVAAAGGTDHALLVQVGDAARTKSELTSALSAIRKQVSTCEFAIPTPRDGRTIDVNKIAVDLEMPNQSIESLTYSADCSAAGGWHFDAEDAPTRVVLCPKTCDAAAASGGTTQVSFHCTDQQKVK
jgi:hypothetical protein